VPNLETNHSCTRGCAQASVAGISAVDMELSF
jgi:hypothetical protein